ncbi:MAG: hypothetical protein KBG28_17110 [Kofleriaceae bacterium]|jgi:hypothetical protein|nr:hypothetical protein [Kofleriaceae bacterium]MBP6840709.1 hypothetical protein [Kofleriaceae bacterium]MBP9205695.1 hypothetical protein [Kofleriaceae bacterium]
MSTTSPRLSVSLAGLIAVLATAAAAAAQPGPGPRPGPPPRHGWELAAGVNGGEINCDSQDDLCDGVTEAGGLYLAATYMFSPRLGVTAETWPMVHSEDLYSFTHVVSTIGVTWRPVPVLAVRGGLGSAYARLQADVVGLDRRTENAPAVLLGAALDVVRAPRWALDVHARVGAGFYGNDADGDGEPDVVARNVGLGLAFTYLLSAR